jgi:hypothetical protein
VLTGARQTGKTSLLGHLLPTYRSVSLDLPTDADEAENNPDEFLSRHPPPLVVDEVQYAPKLFRHIKRRVDQHRRENGQFVLTGSQALTLMADVSDSLAGRAAVLELETLSTSELARTPGPQAYPELIVRGGFPELWARPELDPLSFYRSYVATYLERDVRTLLRVHQLRDFERFLRACALRSGQLLNKAELARDVGVSPTTANDWLSVLQATRQVFLLEPYFANRSGSITKTPKLYLADTGLLCFLVGIRSAADLAASPLAGAIWETLVAGELRKRLDLTVGASNLFFLRDRQREVDFLVPRGGRYALFEAKWTEHPGAQQARGFDDVAPLVGADRIASRTILCRAPTPYTLADGTRINGLWDWRGEEV